MSGLWVEVDPNDVAAVGHIGSCVLRYHTSPPTGRPVETSAWRFFLVMPLTSSASEYFRLRRRTLRKRISSALTRSMVTVQPAKSAKSVARAFLSTRRVLVCIGGLLRGI